MLNDLRKYGAVAILAVIGPGERVTIETYNGVGNYKGIFGYILE